MMPAPSAEAEIYAGRRRTALVPVLDGMTRETVTFSSIVFDALGTGLGFVLGFVFRFGFGLGALGFVSD